MSAANLFGITLPNVIENQYINEPALDGVVLNPVQSNIDMNNYVLNNATTLNTTNLNVANIYGFPNPPNGTVNINTNINMADNNISSATNVKLITLYDCVNSPGTRGQVLTSNAVGFSQWSANALKRTVYAINGTALPIPIMTYEQLLNTGSSTAWNGYANSDDNEYVINISFVGSITGVISPSFLCYAQFRNVSQANSIDGETFNATMPFIANVSNNGVNSYISASYSDVFLINPAQLLNGNLFQMWFFGNTNIPLTFSDINFTFTIEPASTIF